MVGILQSFLIKNLAILVLLPVFAVFLRCQSTPSELEAENLKKQGVLDRKYYLRHNLFLQKKNIHYTANRLSYRFIPVNTETTIHQIDGERIKFSTSQYGETFYIINQIQYSRQSMGDIFRRTFSEKPEEISATSVKNRPLINEARSAPRMSKLELIMALGYPPFHETKSLESNQWIYWISIRRKVDFLFDNNEVIFVTGDTYRSTKIRQ